MIYPLEGEPCDEQKSRLEDWLTELKIICRRYQLMLDTDDGETRILDLTRGTTIGFGITYLLEDSGQITGFDCAGSILDGVWLIDTVAGPREQRAAGRVWPQRSDQ